MVMLDKVHAVMKRYEELQAELGSAETVSNPSRMEKLGREYSSIGKNMPVFSSYASLVRNLAGAREILQAESDPELVGMAREEAEGYEAQLPALEEKVKLLLVPKDPDDMKNAVVEIRAGTGGIEAGIFAADLYRMYTRFAERKNWKIDVMSSSYGDLGSVKEVIFMVLGDNAYGTIKHESGVHRVQRVPQTEAQGRIHTSAASVAVFPEADELEVQIDPSDLRIDVYRSSGHGGQSVNTTDSAVRVVHLPTGLTVTCQDEKSQHKNKAKALKVLQSRLYDARMTEIRDKETAARRSMVSTGDRSAKIRTYNFPQNRVTDHRINLTLYNLDSVIEGDIQQLTDALVLADTNRRLEQAAVG